ncbi:unnamed protein product [Trichobilharzia regenti]|nr:unnamed protein product [Trichobilharzia regenti]
MSTPGALFLIGYYHPVGTVKLFDFSLAHAEDEVLEDLMTRFCEEDDYQNDCLRDLTVHSEYDSPETITKNSNTKMSDYWGLGCLFYNMFYGRPPFTSSSQEEASFVKLLLAY